MTHHSWMAVLTIGGGFALLVGSFIAWDLIRLRRQVRFHDLDGLTAKRRRDELHRIYEDLHEQAQASRQPW